jgi:hypothetical protein
MIRGAERGGEELTTHGTLYSDCVGDYTYMQMLHTDICWVALFLAAPYRTCIEQIHPSTSPSLPA